MQQHHHTQHIVLQGHYLHQFSYFYRSWRQLFSLIMVAVCLLLLFGCEKEIQLDLEGVESKYVIEAVLTDQEGGCKVLISKTKNFEEDNTRITVSDAIVSITQGDTNYELEETSAGTYELATLKGEQNQTYELNVKIGEESFTATSTMPALVNMDSLYISEEYIFDKTYKLPTIDFMDPPAMGNNYRFVIYVNNVKKKQLFTFNDELSNGRANAIRLYLHVGEDDENPENERIASGDLVRVEMLNIDLPVYKYFFSLENSATGENQSATPANPVTNIKGGALGYFSAHTFQQKEIKAP